MHRRSLHLTIAFAWLISLAGCFGWPGHVPDTLELVGEYSNPDGQPVFTVLPGLSNPYIVYRKQPVRLQGQQVTISLNDVSIDVMSPRGFTPSLEIRKTEDITSTATIHLPVNYRIAEDVVAQEFVDGKWKTFSEFDAFSTSTARIGVVVIVDSSKSIDRQLGAARSSAVSLADSLARQWPEGRVWMAVVPFDRDAPLPVFNTDKETVKRAISNSTVVPYTPLYDVMANAADAFANFEKQQALVEPGFTFDKRWILLFTDGLDNYSERYTLETLPAKLADSNVAIYALGIQGLDRLDQGDLNTLSHARYLGLTGLPSEELRARRQRIVDTILDQSPTLYDVTYVRNDQTIEQPRRIKLIFEIEK